MLTLLFISVLTFQQIYPSESLAELNKRFLSADNFPSERFKVPDDIRSSSMMLLNSHLKSHIQKALVRSHEWDDCISHTTRVILIPLSSLYSVWSLIYEGTLHVQRDVVSLRCVVFTNYILVNAIDTLFALWYAILSILAAFVKMWSAAVNRRTPWLVYSRHFFSS